MADLTAIHVVVTRARRRLRLQAAAEVGCAAIPLGACVALTATIAELPALYLAAGGLVALGAIAGAAWPRRDQAIAARLDRANGLADRLTTALALDGASNPDPVTRDLARLAVADGVHAASRADVRAAAPFHTPRHLRAAVGAIALAAIIAALGLTPAPAQHGRLALHAAAVDERVLRTATEVDAEPTLTPEDLAYLTALLDDVRAAAPDDPAVQAWADAVASQLAAAAAGEVSKADVLAALDQLASPGALGPLGDDVLEGVRQARPPGTPPPPPEPPPPPPPPADVVCENPGGDTQTPLQPAEAPPAGLGGKDPGETHDDHLAGDPTKQRHGHEDEHLSGDAAKGPSRREAVVSAARLGFASAAYRDVYADYRAIVEEVLHGEHVPSSYRYVVKRYFQRIHPS